MIKVNEIFYSIQGESTLVGLPTVFVRTSGCHLRCHYCDTKYAYHDGRLQSVSDIQNEVAKYGARHVCITGGEPLLQKEVLALMANLCEEGYTVSLETSGDKSCHEVDLRVKIILDIKTPGSGEGGKFDPANLNLSHRDIEIKFVVCSESDFEWAEDFCRQHHLFEKFTVLYSPSYAQLDPKWLAEKILHEKSTARLQLQLHKYIWSPYARGV